MKIKSSICTPLMMELRKVEWKKQWIETYMLAGEVKADAEHAYEVLYGNQSIDIHKDPIEDAKSISGVIES